jgi:4-amino-4-deoxy-L-arabinose transferase-like glycosyltransferase
MRRLFPWLLGATFVIAIFFRLYHINIMPGGLFPDEAANGLDINLMQQGHLQPFYERGNGREALFFYLLWASVTLFGKGPWQHHLVSGLVGIFAVLGCYLVTRSLFRLFAKTETDREQAKWWALLASFFMATNAWHIVLSRTAFRANMIALVAPFMFWAMLNVAQAKTWLRRLLWGGLAGVLCGLGFYTYIAFRILLPIIGILILWPLLAALYQRMLGSVLKKYILAFVAFAVMFGLVMIPIVHYFQTHPGTFIGRSGQVSIFNPDLNKGNLVGTFIDVSKKSILAYFGDGDLNWRHNISGYPFLSPIISVFFAIGLVLVTLRAAAYTFKPARYESWWQDFFLAGWFWGLLVPVVTTAEGIPHGLRSIGTIPAVFIITIIGVQTVVGVVTTLRSRYWFLLSPHKRHILLIAQRVLIASFVVALISQAYILYFIEAKNSPDNFFAFRSDLTVVSDYLKEYGHKETTKLVLDKFSIQTVDYFTSTYGQNPADERNNPYQQVDPEDSWKLTDLTPQDDIVFTQSSIFDITKFKQYHPTAYLVREDKNQFNETVMAVYKVK